MKYISFVFAGFIGVLVSVGCLCVEEFEFFDDTNLWR